MGWEEPYKIIETAWGDLKPEAVGVVHRHKPNGAPVDEKYENGSRLVRSACSCGQLLDWRHP